MKTKLIFLLIFLGITLPVFAQQNSIIEHQLVTVRVTYQNWNEYRPWQKSQPGARRFFGIVLPKNRILVMADYLEDATLIQIEKFDHPPRYPARIIHSDPQVNLALITVDDPAFFKDLKPVQIAPELQGESYSCASWQNGQLVTASCRFSRVVSWSNYTPYFRYPGIYFITDLKNGGRGEPLFNEKKELTGLTIFQSNNQMVVLPSEVIQTYLKAVSMPIYPKFAQLGVTYQYNRGAAQAKYLGLKGPVRGVRIQNTLAAGSAHGIIQPNDLLLELDGHAIDCEGKYVHPHYGRLNFNLIPDDKHLAGDVITAKVLRNGKELNLKIPLKNIPPSADLIPETRYNQPPPYLFAGGLVFRELDVPYLKAWGSNWRQNIPPRLRVYLEMDAQKQGENRRLIILADVFPDQYNLGYHDLSQLIISKVNGKEIRSIADMEEAFKHPQGDFHVIECIPNFGISKIILDAKTFDAATQRIMKTYHISHRLRLRKSLSKKLATVSETKNK